MRPQQKSSRSVSCPAAILGEMQGILHVDLDAFYASVEQLLRPELAGKPVLVGGGVVLAASYEARARGVSAPMGIRQALHLCPDAVVVNGSFERYGPMSKQVMAICADVTPLVEQISIDEAFLDVRGSVHLLGSPDEIGHQIRSRVASEVGLPISVGIASTKFLAKVASGQAKPDGLLRPENEIAWLHELPVSVMWGVGPVRNAILAEYGIRTVGDLAHASTDHLTAWLGPAAAAHFHALAWNRDRRSVHKPGRAGSMGSQSALGRGLTDETDLSVALLRIADRVSARMRKKGRAGRTITVRARFAEMQSATRAITLPAAVATTAALHAAAIELLADARREHPGPVTLVAISMSKLETAGPLQLELPFTEGGALQPGSPIGAAYLSIDEQVDRARERFGKDAVGRASVVLGGDRGVPDEFRELAERD